MPAFVIVAVDVTDPDTYSTCSRDVPAALESFGGRFIVRGGACEVIEGTFPTSCIVMLEFPNLVQAKARHAVNACQVILPIRQQHAETRFMVAVEGTT